MIDLYTYPTPNGQKASVMLEEVGLPYTVREVDLMKGEQRNPDFLRISPNNKIPAIVDDDGPEGQTTIFESGAILVYLAEKTGKFLPANGSPRAGTLQWLFWAMTGVGPGIGRFTSVALFTKDPDATLVRSLAEEVVRLFVVLEKRLSEVEYLADDYSIADIGAFTWVPLRASADREVRRTAALRGHRPLAGGHRKAVGCAEGPASAETRRETAPRAHMTAGQFRGVEVAMTKTCVSSPRSRSCEH